MRQMPYFGTLVIISGLLGFWQEGGVSNAAEKFLVLVQVKATVLSNGHNRVRLCKSTRFDGNAGDHWSDNNPSLDTFGNAAGISTVVVEFCAVGAIVVFYITVAENVKGVFDSRVQF
jgi:hypothetical protein